MIEMDATYSKAATSLSSNSIHHQFSKPVNLRTSQLGTEFIRGFADNMETGRHKPDLSFQENVCLFLASTESQEKVLMANHQVQACCVA
ncbi:MAG: hypothetical protein OXD44_05600 [Gammaproteobacteria bacterium]|nr:hypothetical protein [Gammaproteobacteria bacterium]MCY4229066.1 hypothetical protein [Gammaproteobacteria bacterium]MCY4313161.1 hypothetical protein [Gammaproteobacteria bacterium]